MIKKIEYSNTINFSPSGNDLKIDYSPSFTDKLNIKIKRAILILPVSSINTSLNYEVCNIVTTNSVEKTTIIDCFKNASSNNLVCIDISDELQDVLNNNQDKLSLKIKNAVDNITLSDGSKVVIDLFNKKQNINNSNLKVNCKRAGQGYINLSSGMFQFVHNDIVSNKKVLPIKIDHVYNSFLANKTIDNVDSNMLPDFNCSYGWKLNAQQYLIKEKYTDSLLSDNKSVGKFTYIDGNGNHNEFYERYYYLDSNNEKHYLIASQVHMTETGELKYLDANGKYLSVKSEICSDSGLTLTTRPEGFSGLSLVEKDVEDLANLKSEIKNIKFTINQIQNSINSNNLSEHLRLDSFKINKKNQDLQQKSITNESLNISNSRDLLTKKKDISDKYKLYRDELNTRTFAHAGEDNQPTQTEHTYKLNYDSASDTAEIFENSLNVSNLNIRESVNSLNQDLLNSNIDYANKNSNAQKIQIDDALELLYKQKQYYDTLLQKKILELKTFQKNIPVHYITDTNGFMLGFGCFNSLGDTSEDYEDNQTQFRLILIADNYKNSIYICYDDNNQITSIIDADNKKITLEYENGLLSYITDDKNRKTEFTYDKQSKNLVKITYPNNQCSCFSYNLNGLLSEIIEPSGYGTSLTYSNNLVINVKEITKTSKITDNICTKIENPQIKDEVQIDYYDIRSTILTNLITNKSTTYVFDSLGNTQTIYDNKFENGEIIGNVKAITYDRLNDKKSFKIQTLDSAEDYLSGIEFDSYPSSTTAEYYLGDDLVAGDISNLVSLNTNQSFDSNIYTLTPTQTTKTKIEKNIPNNKINEIINSGITDFILSGWAKADAAWVDRRATDYSNNDVIDISLDGGETTKIIRENLDQVKQNRRFELRAELTYSNNGITKTIEQYCSFDWMNTDWQYCALPVTLSEDPNDILIGLKVVFDYSYNTNTAQFFGMTLKEGIWEYAEYNDNKLKTYYQNSHSKMFITYEYEDKKLTKEIIHKNGEEYTTYYHYNSNAQLVRATAYNDIITENEYNDKGTLIKSYTYHKNEPSAKLYSQEDLLEENGNSKLEVNEFGETTLENSYIYGTGIVSNTKFKNGSIIAYGYDPNDDSLLSMSVSIDDETNYNLYGYNLGLLTSLSHNSFEYNFDYDGFGRITKIDIANSTYSEISYEQSKNTTTLAPLTEKEEKFIQTFDDSNNLLNTHYTNNSKNIDKKIVENSYDSYGKLLRTTDYSNDDVGVCYDLEYDKYGNINKKTYAQNNKNIEISSITNNDENKTNETIKIGTTQTSIEYDYSNKLDSKLTAIKFNNIVGQTIDYDKLGRINQTNIPKILTKQYNYLQKGDHSSNFIASEWFGNNKVIMDSLKYSYDMYGNIVAIKENGVEIVHYTYDELSRLIREDNKKLNKTTVFSYDIGGNILEKVEFMYTKKPTKELVGGTRFAYHYPTSGWKDQLLKFNNENFVYDNLGNPTTYRDKTLTWKYGRQLASFENITYKYNADGIRISKTNADNITTHFYLDGTKILAQDNGNLLTFKYGIDGVIGFTYQGVGDFYYKKNIFGDIIGIIDKNGQEIAKYTYDAWGNHKSYALNNGTFVDISLETSYTQDGLNNKLIAELNPFRYRGYYFDTETHLYYLNSRYYDPEIGRFINADEINYLNPETINGLNLYAYCINNPLLYYDIKGRDPYKISTFSSINNNKFIFANIVERFSTSQSSIKNNLFKLLFFNITGTITKQIKEPGLFYAYDEIGNGGKYHGYGVGVNFASKFQFEFGITVGAIEDYALNMSTTIGKIGIGFSLGVTGLGLSISLPLNDTTTITIGGTIGFGTIAVAAALAFIPVPGFRFVSGLILFLDWLF